MKETCQKDTMDIGQSVRVPEEKISDKFSEREPNPVPIRGSVKAAHMRRFIRADDAWEPFGGVSQGIRRVHHYYQLETGPGQP